MIIEQGNPLYDTLMSKWRAQQGGSDVRHNGSIYLVVKDNKEIRFSLKGADNPFGVYGETSFR